MLRAVVTAGGRVDGAFAAAIGSPFKALAPFGERPLIDVVLTAIAECGIAGVAVVGDQTLAPHLAGRARLIPAADDGAINVARALDAWPDGDDLLFATSDLPFAAAGDLRAFLERSAAFDLTMPLAEASAYATAYPGAPPHLTALGGERVAGGSVFFIAAAARAPLRAVAGRFFATRKSALGMARLLGSALLLRYCVRRLRIADVERRAARTLGVRAAAIRDAAPGLCYDVDTLADYEYAWRLR
jgi:GTP:adenosylcobinamide-phosphate guanylyltransferase